MKDIKLKEKKMFKAKLIIIIVTAVFLVTLSNSFSQEKTFTGSNRNLIIQAGKDSDPQTGIFKIYSSKQTQFDNTTIIKFELGEEANVLLTVTDADGKVITTLIDDTMDAGTYDVNYKSSDKITSGKFTYTLKIKGVSGIKNMFAVK